MVEGQRTHKPLVVGLPFRVFHKLNQSNSRYFFIKRGLCIVSVIFNYLEPVFGLYIL